jgi:hypothetical protein
VGVGPQPGRFDLDAAGLAAYVVTPFQDDDFIAALGQFMRGRKASHPSAEDNDSIHRIRGVVSVARERAPDSRQIDVAADL